MPENVLDKFKQVFFCYRHLEFRVHSPGTIGKTGTFHPNSTKSATTQITARLLQIKE